MINLNELFIGVVIIALFFASMVFASFVWTFNKDKFAKRGILFRRIKMDNVYGCKGCMYLTKEGKCKYEDELSECLEDGDCSKYEESEFETKLIEIIKNKVDKASVEELEEALQIVNKKLDALSREGEQ